MIRWFFLFLICAFPACAGPWLRTKGTGFSATTIELSPADPSTTAPYPPMYSVDAYNSVYIEYGLAPRLTIGLDGGSDLDGNGSGFAFLRFPLREGHPSRIAGEIAIGARWSLDDLTLLLRPGLSWGRGITFFDKPGWTTLDATLTIPSDGGRITPKIDAMLGLNTSDRLKLMLGLTLERPTLTLSPSIAYRTWGRYHLTLGLKLHSEKSRPLSVAFGFWQDF